MKDKIKQELKGLADEKYQEFHSGLCPGTNNILGVRVPVLRDYAKQLAKQDWKTILKEMGHEYYEEIMLEGMLIGLANMELEERLQYLTNFIPKIDNWAVCDVVCAGLKFTKKNQEEMWEFIKHYLQSKKEFELRFGIVMLLDFYIIDTYIDSVITILDSIKHDGYYVKMAIAWTISVAYIKYPKQTMQYLKHNTLDDFTFNKALQKMIESYRVTKEEKEIIRSMKRR